MSIKVEKILELYEIIKNRLPKSYPRPRLVFFEDDIQMAKYHKFKMADNEVLYGTYDGKDTIGVPLNVYQEFELDSGKIKTKKVAITSDIDYLAVILLHELFHAYYLQKYGPESKEYSDEKLIDSMAYKWVRKMKREKLF